MRERREVWSDRAAAGRLRAALLASLGLAQLVGCGGETSDDSGGGAGGAAPTPQGTGGIRIPAGLIPTGGAFDSGGAVANGGVVSSGGAVSTGGSGGRPQYSPICAPADADAPTGVQLTPKTIPAPGSFTPCAGGWEHRPAQGKCETQVPRAEPAEPALENSCASDADCTEKAFGWCGRVASGMSRNECHYGCVQDSDCGASQLCRCGDPVGECVPASCATDADCGGALCASYAILITCLGPGYACQTPEDTCNGDGDCIEGEHCVFQGGKRSCVSLGCSPGRPFLIGGQPRLAGAEPREDWTCELGHCSEASAGVRAALATAWTRTALMEHASIAAFARFSLELLAFGAPAELVASASCAMADEIEHARQAFAFASYYAGEALGPSALVIDGSLDRIDLDASVVTTFLEGCIGETVAALEARHAADAVEDPLLRQALAKVADDEARHALLAFEFLKWALPRAGAGLRDVLQTELTNAEALASFESAAPGEPDLAAYGIVSQRRASELRRAALKDVVRPCLGALLAEMDRAASVNRPRPRAPAPSRAAPEHSPPS